MSPRVPGRFNRDVFDQRCGMSYGKLWGSVRSTWGSYSQRIPPEAVTNVTNELLVGFDWCKTWGRKSATTSSTIFLSPSPKSFPSWSTETKKPIFGGTGSPIFGEHFLSFNGKLPAQPKASHSRLVMDTCGPHKLDSHELWVSNTANNWSKLYCAKGLWGDP